jgi:hypothetical protein
MKLSTKSVDNPADKPRVGRIFPLFVTSWLPCPFFVHLANIMISLAIFAAPVEVTEMLNNFLQFRDVSDAGA